MKTDIKSKLGDTFVFAGRNIKELLRTPISWCLGIAMPIGIFIILQIIMKSIGEAAVQETPMFAVSRFTGGVVGFAASFLSIFTALLISGDRSNSFLSRLYASPMDSGSFVFGYIIAVLPLAAVQVAVTFIAAMCFGLELSVNILAAMVFGFFFSLLYISIGVIFGTAMSAKSAPPVCSVVIQVGTLLSGMWFDLDMIGGGFRSFCLVLPFARCYDLIRYTLAGNWGQVWQPFLIITAYIAVLAVCAVVLFRKKKVY